MSFIRSNSGNVAMMFALLLIPLVAAAGVAADFLRSSQAKTQLAEALDAGLLAAARAKVLNPSLSNADATKIARKAFDANNHGGPKVTIESFAFSPTGAEDTYQVRLTGSLNTSLMGVVGIDLLDLDLTSEAGINQPGPVEVVLALDNTGSMLGDKLNNLITSAKGLVDTLDGVTGGDFYYALVPFAHYVNVGASHAGANWIDGDAPGWSGCVGSRNAPYDQSDGGFGSRKAPAVFGVDCPEEISPLTPNAAAIKTKIDGMTASGLTYIPAGLTWAIRVISNETPFTEGIPYAKVKPLKGQKVIVLMTDGANTVSTNYPYHDGTDVDDANTKLEATCAEAHAKEITVYTIAFDVAEPEIEAILSACATEDGGYFDADNSTELKASFDVIATNIASIALTK